LESAPLLLRLDLEVAHGDRALRQLFAVPIRAVCWRLREAQAEVEDMRRWLIVEVLVRGPTFAGYCCLLVLALTLYDERFVG
jgi:hypothetical protein